MVSLNELGSAALVLVVASFLIGIGAVLLTSQSTATCTSISGNTWFTGKGNTTNASTAMQLNPLDSSWSGCCQTVNKSYPQGVENGGYCRTWETTRQDINVSYQGITSMTTFGTWIPIIAVVVAAVVVIGLLVTYLGGGLGRRRM